MNFGENLKELRKKNELTQLQLSKILDTSKSNISKYEAGSIEPNLSILARVSTYFSVSTDYLLGLSELNQKKNYNFHDFFVSFFFGYWDKCQIRIYERMKELSISKSDLMNETNIDLEKEISLDNLVTIAKKLDISMDYLLGLSDIKYISQEDINYIQSITERERDVINTFRKLDADNKDIIVGDMKKYIKEQHYESITSNNIVEKTGT